MDTFLEDILNHCLDILESDSGSILLLDKNSRDIVVRVARGRHKTSILGERMRLGEGISGLVAQQRRPLFVADIRKEERIRRRCRLGKYRTHSFLSVPLMDTGKLLGVINITEKAAGKSFTIKELSFVSAIAASTAKAILCSFHTAHLEKELQNFKNSTAVKRFTSAIAQELNNPLDGVLRYTQLCLSQAAEESLIKEYLIEVKAGLKRMAGIVRAMMEFSFAGDRTHSPLFREEVDVNRVIEKTLSFYRGQAQQRRIKIRTELADNLPRIKDCGLQQVFVNCITNALDAIDHDGILLVKDYKSNGHLCVDFIDSGIGIQESLKDKIFEPFFTTKPCGRGLGLSIVREIVTSCYNGEITTEGVSHGGAKFTVKIPIGGIL